jgi:dolichol kinase
MAERLYDTIFTSLALRKGYHFAGGLVLFLITCFLSDTGIFAALVFYFLAFLILGRRISFAVLGVLLMFATTHSRFATLGAIVIFTIGDGLAAHIGSTFGRAPLPWNPRKTALGSVAFLAGSIISMMVFLTGASPGASGGTLLLILVPSAAACIVESLPISAIRDRKPDDNLLVIMASGLSLRLLVVLLGTPDISCCGLAA